MDINIKIGIEHDLNDDGELTFDLYDDGGAPMVDNPVIVDIAKILCDYAEGFTFPAGVIKDADKAYIAEVFKIFSDNINNALNKVYKDFDITPRD